MPDVEAAAPSAAQTQAESSPAPVNHQEVLNNLTPDQRVEWRKTGNIPEPSKADSATAKPSDAEADGASVKAEPQERAPKRDNAETRLKELLADLKNAGLSPAELKTFKREAQRVETKAEPSPAPQKVEAKPKREAPKEPDISDKKYEGDDGWKLYDRDLKQYARDVAEHTKAEAIEQFKRESQEEYQRQKLGQELAQGRSKYKDFDQITTPVIQSLQQEGMSKEVIEVVGRSPVFVDLLYVIGEKEADRDEFLQLAKSDPWAAVRKAVIMENLITEELAKQRDGKAETKPRDDSGKFLPTPEKKVTGAPAPVSEVGGRAAAPGDAVQESIQKRDFSKYRAEMNRREMTARK